MEQIQPGSSVMPISSMACPVVDGCDWSASYPEQVARPARGIAQRAASIAAFADAGPTPVRSR